MIVFWDTCVFLAVRERAVKAYEEPEVLRSLEHWVAVSRATRGRNSSALCCVVL
jgi:hypothetical protein